MITGPETEVSADKTRATTRMFETVQDGVLQRSWCIIPGDPPGTYTYDITIDGEPRGEFVFCAIEVPNQDLNTDPRLAIFRQTDNGVPVRMALFAQLLGVDGLVQRSLRDATWRSPAQVGVDDALLPEEA